MTQYTIAKWALMAWMVMGTISRAADPMGSPVRNLEGSKPNVVYILSDDQGWGDYSFMGHPHIQTPNLDRLARESLVFTRGYVPDSLCRPSLATIITGLYPHQHGIVGNDPPVPSTITNAKGKPYAHPDYIQVREAYFKHMDRASPLPKILGKEGYRSLQTGKWWEGNVARGGFDEGMTHGDMTRGGRHGDIGLKIGREGMASIEEFVKRMSQDKKPFFLWYAPMMPHTPHDPPARLLDKYKSKTDSLPIAKYWAMCEWFDETIGSLRSILDQNGVADNTIIVYVCDNGWINDPKASQYAPRSKRSPNEGGTRTPIMVHWKGHVQPRMDREHLASSIDLVPTTLAALGLPRPSELKGINLVDNAAVGARKEIYGEIFEHDIVSMDEPKDSLMYRWVIQGAWKLIEADTRRLPQAPQYQLFDVVKDPSEDHDLSRQHPEVVSELSRMLESHWKTR